jgi:hypothetical protein
MQNLHIPNESALTNAVKARMKMIKDALPNALITFPPTCCPMIAEIVATPAK